MLQVQARPEVAGQINKFCEELVNTDRAPLFKQDCKSL